MSKIETTIVKELSPQFLWYPLDRSDSTSKVHTWNFDPLMVSSYGYRINLQEVRGT